MASLRTPIECLEFAKDAMLDGRDPVTHEDWQRIVNCFAANVMKEAIPLLCVVLDVPLHPAEIEAIVTFQTTGKVTRNGRVISC